MNPKYSIFYLLLLPGMIFSLISIFVGFSWIVLLLSFLIGIILYIKESGILIRPLVQPTENTAPAISAPTNRAVDILKKTPWLAIAVAAGAIIVLAVIAIQYGSAITAFLKP